jgi:microcystin-dependent protein
MADPYVGEIRMFSGTFAPVGWAFCNGQIVAISDNEVLFSLIGTSYGGDGQTTFALPNMQGRVPVHTPLNIPIGGISGSETVTLDGSNLPVHTHPFSASTNPANSGSPENAVPANSTASGAFLYFTDTPRNSMAPQSLAFAGGSQAHDNVQPFLCISFIIALQGIYPSRS